MRKPRDIDAELKTLQDRQKQLRARKSTQLGELVQATGADVLPVEILAGALLDAVAKADDDTATEAWRRRGQGFFRERTRGFRADGAHEPARAAPADGASATPGDGRPAPG